MTPQKIEKILPKTKDHICRFNDGDCVCDCYVEARKDLLKAIPAILQADREAYREEMRERMENHEFTNLIHKDGKTFVVFDEIKDLIK